MDEKLEYSQNAPFTSFDVTSKWQRGASAITFDSYGSTRNYLPQDRHIQYLPAKEFRSSQPQITASILEKLAYFRCYVTTPIKTYDMCSFDRIQRLLWPYIITLLYKSVPHTYVNVFLAAYAREDHFFVTKMVPIFYGLSVSCIVAAIFEMTIFVENNILLLKTTITAIIDKNPWNRCEHYPDVNVSCYTISEFAKKFVNVTKKPFFNPSSNLYETHNESFQVSQIYYITVGQEMSKTYTIFHNKVLAALFVWSIITLNYKQLFKKYVWKGMHITQLCVNIGYFIVFVHLSVIHVLTRLDNFDKPVKKNIAQTNLVLNADMTMIAESITTPPSIHILTSRGIKEIQPARDSATIVVSNAIYYIFRILVAYQVKEYCDKLVKTEIHKSSINEDSFFYFWPMYWSTFYLSEIFTFAFFGLHFLMEMCCLIITFQCLVEAIVCQWKINRALVSFLVFIVGYFWNLILDVEPLFFIYIVTKGIVTMLELIGVYLFYPCGRLIDDITFYVGSRPPKLLEVIMCMIPVIFSTKLYILFKLVFQFIEASRLTFSPLLYFLISASMVILPFLIGFFYAGYVYLFKEDRDWKSLFRPDVHWGLEFTNRTLRKQYDSRTYIRSQAPRQLSRYMIKKRESRVYNLDIRYEAMSRRSTVQADVRFDSERRKSGQYDRRKSTQYERNRSNQSEPKSSQYEKRKSVQYKP